MSDLSLQYQYQRPVPQRAASTSASASRGARAHRGMTSFMRTLAPCLTPFLTVTPFAFLLFAPASLCALTVLLLYSCLSFRTSRLSPEPHPPYVPCPPKPPVSHASFPGTSEFRIRSFVSLRPLLSAIYRHALLTPTPPMSHVICPSISPPVPSAHLPISHLSISPSLHAPIVLISDRVSPLPAHTRPPT